MSEQPTQPRRLRLLSSRLPAAVPAALEVLAAVAVATGAVAALQSSAPAAGLGAIYLLAVLEVAVRRGGVAALATAEYGEETHYLRVHVAHIRAKLEADPARPRYLVTEPGVGYRLREPEN